MDAKAHNNCSDTGLVKMVGATPLFSPHSLKRTVGGTDTDKEKGTAESSDAAREAQRAGEWPPRREQQRGAQATDPGGTSGCRREGGDAEHTGTEGRKGTPTPALPHREKAPPAPQRRQKLRTGRGVGEVISDKNRELKRTDTSRTSRASAFFLLWLPDVGRTL